MAETKVVCIFIPSKAIRSVNLPFKMVEITVITRSNDAYQRTETPSQEHSIMTKFIVQPYAATVFDIYQKPHIRYGSFHYFNFAKRCIRSLGIESEIWQEVVKPNFLRVGTW